MIKKKKILWTRDLVKSHFATLETTVINDILSQLFPSYDEKSIYAASDTILAIGYSDI
jgi:hypothetical protein